MVTDEATLKSVSCDIKKAFSIDFEPAWTLLITWSKVKANGYQNKEISNTFQSVLVSNKKYSFIIFDYGKIEWPSNIMRNKILVGYNSGDDVNYHSINDIKSLSSKSNINVESKWIFRVDTKGVTFSFE